MAKFTYNNALNASTGLSPFFVNKGYHLNISVCPKIDIQSDHDQDFVTNLDEIHSFLQEEITLAQNQYKEQANQKCIPAPDFPIGSEVFIYTKNIKSNWPTKKFSKKYLGLFKIIAWPGTLSYKLQLPKYLSQIHPVFHISHLEPVTPNKIPNQTQSPPPPVEIHADKLISAFHTHYPTKPGPLENL